MTIIMSWVALASAVLAPAATAWIIFAAASGRSTWPMPDAPAALLALAIEFIGVTATHTILVLRSYNATKRKSDPAAPVSWAWAILGGYIAVTLFLTIALHVIPSAVIVAPALLPLLSLAAFGVLAVRQDHEARLAAVTEAAQERKAERRERKAAQVVPQETPATLDTRARVLAFYRNDPHGTFTACASQAGVSRQRVAQVVKVLEEEGVISRNGKVKVA